MAEPQPEEMDIATLIAIQEDPEIRQMMMQNLTSEQIDLLPSYLRIEALNFLHGGNNRQERDEERKQHEEEKIKKRHVGGNRMHKKVIEDPSTAKLDELVMLYTQELDQKMMDDRIR